MGAVLEQLAGARIVDVPKGFPLHPRVEQVYANRRKMLAVETVNEHGFQPYTAQKEVVLPVPLILVFDKRDGIDPRMLARYHALGGESVLVKSLDDAAQALDRG